jgi:hypothetical protein
MKRRVTILSLMALVLVLGVAIAALRNADHSWAGGMVLATPLLLGVALIGALCGEPRSRDRRLGFAILGGAYFALVFLGVSEPNLGRLPTTRVLAYIHQQVAPPQTFTVNIVGPKSDLVPATLAGGGYDTAPVIPVEMPASSSTTAAVSVPATHNYWNRLLPGAANYEPFSVVGHCLFALLAGALGAAIAEWFRKRRERAEPANLAPAS